MPSLQGGFSDLFGAAKNSRPNSTLLSLNMFLYLHDHLFLRIYASSWLPHPNHDPAIDIVLPGSLRRGAVTNRGSINEATSLTTRLVGAVLPSTSEVCFGPVNWLAFGPWVHICS